MQDVIKGTIVAFSCAGADEASFGNLDDFHAAVKVNLEKSLTTSKESLVDTGRRIQDFEQNTDPLYDFETKIDEAEAEFKISKEHVHFLKD